MKINLHRILYSQNTASAQSALAVFGGCGVSKTLAIVPEQAYLTIVAPKEMPRRWRRHVEPNAKKH